MKVLLFMRTLQSNSETKLFCYEALQAHSYLEMFSTPSKSDMSSSRNLVIAKNWAARDDVFLRWGDRMPIGIQRSVGTRQYEYLLGRWAAATMLHEAGCPEALCWISPTSGGPAWPPSFIGSISHSAEAVAVSVEKVPSGGAGTIGIDIENIASPHASRDVLLGCFSKEEVVLLDTIEYGLILGFSAKESLYKCLHPHVKVFFDFRDAEIGAICKFKQELQLNLCRQIPNVERGTRFTAQYRIPTLSKQQLWTQTRYDLPESLPQYRSAT